MNYISDNTKKLLLISRLPKVGRTTLNNLVKSLSDWDMPVQEIINSYVNIPDKTIPDEAYEWVSLNINEAKRNGDYIISQLDQTYPLLLKQTKDAPAFLFCRGNIDLFNKNCLAIIGTREPTEHGKIIAKNITEWFTAKDWTIVSGLALGVDTIAHKSCLSKNGKTIAVLANSLNKVYPKENANLVTEILNKQGLIITEYSYNSTSFKSNFVERDRIQAGLSNGVVLVQSDLKGGSMHASRSILKYNRYLIVANQSKTDIKNCAKKIEANCTLINSSSSLLKTHLDLKDDFDSNLVVKMMGKEEYEIIHSKLQNLPKQSYKLELDL